MAKFSNSYIERDLIMKFQGPNLKYEGPNWGRIVQHLGAELTFEGPNSLQKLGAEQSNQGPSWQGPNVRGAELSNDPARCHQWRACHIIAYSELHLSIYKLSDIILIIYKMLNYNLITKQPLLSIDLPLGSGGFFNATLQGRTLESSISIKQDSVF